MTDWTYIDGTFVQCEGYSDAPYIYQYVRTDGHRPLHLQEHLRRLDEVSWQVCGRGIEVSAKSLSTHIRELLKRGGYAPSEASHTVAVRVTFDGRLSLHCAGTSLYERLSLRAIHPQAAVFECGMPYYDMPTSATEAQSLFLRECAARQGAGAFVTVSADGRVLSVDGAAPVAVCDRTILVARHSLSVEEELFVRTAERNGRRVELGTLLRSDLQRLDELCCIDHRGITAVSGLDGTSYGDIIINAVAERL